MKKGKVLFRAGRTASQVKGVAQENRKLTRETNDRSHPNMGI